jgi:hypothetical protein
MIGSVLLGEEAEAERRKVTLVDGDTVFATELIRLKATWTCPPAAMLTGFNATIPD